MTVAEITKNPFLGRTTTTPRPFATDPDTVYLDEAHLRQKQSQWDAAERWRAEDAALGEASRAKISADRAADEATRRTNARADLEAAVKQRFMAQGHTTEADWARLKGELIDRALLDQPNPVEEQKADLRRSGLYAAF